MLLKCYWILQLWGQINTKYVFFTIHSRDYSLSYIKICSADPQTVHWLFKTVETILWSRIVNWMSTNIHVDALKCIIEKWFSTQEGDPWTHNYFRVDTNFVILAKIYILSWPSQRSLTHKNRHTQFVYNDALLSSQLSTSHQVSRQKN